ncbi:PEP/pyruvate-binding domain-containing protein [Roseimarinus sediminis]|uniref:PEP/pyruvate-binding domain-containing protein n=1 Tax=Roseimarinus sediminis TaxID=1610899 RepID=UPI003D20CEFE
MIDIKNVSLASIYEKRKSDRDIFQELMPTKVKEILLIATKYDAYSIVREGQFSDKIFGEYLQLNLYSAPRFTSVNTYAEAIDVLDKKHFDMVIIMAGVDREAPVSVAREINSIKPRLPILLLVNNNYDLAYFTKTAEPLHFIDRVFVWNGNTTIFLAMIKYIEDKKNVWRDVNVGSVRIILLVEDSVKYYSRYLPLLYTHVMLQTQNLVSDDSTDELHMILKMRARPKILLVSNYEEAIAIVNKYKDNLLCVISDVKFSRNGIDDIDAGIELLKYVKQTIQFEIPLLLQSHDVSNEERAATVGADFINKNSDSLSKDIQRYIFRRLGFGNFEFLMPDGRKVAEAHSLHEFQELMKKVPIESILYHASRNEFSKWLMARGEINMAEQLMVKQADEFEHKKDVRDFILKVFENVKMQQLRGRIVNFDPSLVKGNRYLIRLSKGSLGGKGRGLAFISNFIENIDFKKIIPNINIRMPATAIIGALEFDAFIEANDLYNKIIVQHNYDNINELFLKGKISEALNERLFLYLVNMKKPLAVRSSGLFEDSLLQPFAGVYSTFLLPNNHPNINVRHQQLREAIKLVYASTFAHTARSYFNAVNYKVEEEKMAVIIQEVVGHEYNQKYYPHISGIAQSYNYYPVAYMEPSDGFSVAGVGLGMYVVGGEKSFRFCPRYPKINPASVNDLMRDTQVEFYAIDMTRSEFDLDSEGEMATIKKFPIREAEKDGTITHLVSTYDFENDMLLPGTQKLGPRVIDFANVLKYDHIPLADSLHLLLSIFKEAMGAPVELEYSVDLDKSDENGQPTLYLLQIKPLIRKEDLVLVDIDEADRSNTLMYATRGMGNGKLDHIRDLIYVDIASFDRTRTREMARELGRLNDLMVEEKKEYILIGPGRWGTLDPFTGIPVVWSQISNARVIVELGLEDFPIDASLGSHFFHNVTSMNVGYFSVPYNSGESFVNTDMLKVLPVVRRTNYIKHVRFSGPLEILMDGRARKIMIRQK